MLILEGFLQWFPLFFLFYHSYFFFPVILSLSQSWRICHEVYEGWFLFQTLFFGSLLEEEQVLAVLRRLHKNQVHFLLVERDLFFKPISLQADERSQDTFPEFGSNVDLVELSCLTRYGIARELIPMLVSWLNLGVQGPFIVEENALIHIQCPFKKFHLEISGLAIRRQRYISLHSKLF